MFFKSLEYIKELENCINSSYSLPIFKGYVAINKRGVEKIIDELYASLPVDVQRAREYLKNNDINPERNVSKGADLYGCIKNLAVLFDKGFEVMNLSIVSSAKAKELINKVVENMPKEIFQAKKIDKTK